MEELIEKIWLKYAKLFTIDGDILQGALYMNHTEFVQAMTEAMQAQAKACADVYFVYVGKDYSYRESIKNKILNAKVKP